MDKLLEHFLWLWSIEKNTDLSHFLVSKGNVFIYLLDVFTMKFVFKNIYMYI